MSPSRKQFAIRVLAAAVTGVCMPLASPDLSWWWLSFFAWLPYLWAIEGQSARRALFFGLVSGAVAVFIGFMWMTELLVRFGGIPLPASLPIHLLFSSFQGLQWALPAMVVAWLAKRRGISPMASLPLAWVAVEATLPNVFPTYIPMLWCWHPQWLQLAEIGGVTTVSFVMLAINGALYVVVRNWFAHRQVHRIAAATFVALMIGVPSYGAIRMSQIDALITESESLKIGVVQGNFGIGAYGNPRPRSQLHILKSLQDKSAELESEGAELLLWGETAYPFVSFSRDSSSDLPEGSFKRVRKGFSAPLVLGAITVDRSNENPYPWNTAWILNSDDSLGDRYDKNYPLMFGESIPLVDPEWYLQMIPNASYLNTGDGPEVLRTNGYRFGALICYEDILPRFSREEANMGIHAFVNLTNDSWFGKSAAQGEHLGFALMRTIENRRSMVRAVNAGISAHIDPSGRVIQQTKVTNTDVEGWKSADGFVADVALIDPDYKTLYARTGELFNAIVVLILLGLGFRRRRDAVPAT